MVDNASNVFYGIVYAMMFAIPIVGARRDSFGRSEFGCASRRFAVLLVSLSAIFFTIYPIIDVPSPVKLRRKNHCRDRNRECDRRRDLPGWQETSARLAAVLGNPVQIFRQPTRDWNENDLRDIVGMKRAQFFLKR